MSGQWLSLVATIWLQSVSGTNSNFPAYSSQLKHLLSLSQIQLNNLALASDAGKILAWFSGIAAAHLPLWLVLITGSLIGLIGYGVQYLLLINLHYSSYWLVFLLTVLAGNSMCWINTVCYILTIQNFPLDCQIALGLSTSYQGLSAKIYAELMDVLFSNSSSIERAKGYLLLNSVVPVIVCIVAVPLIVINSGIRSRSRNLYVGFVLMFMVTLGTGTFAAISSSLGYTLQSSSNSCRMVIFVGFGVLVFVVPIVVPVVEKIRESTQQKCLIRKTNVCSFVGRENVGFVCEEIGVKLMLKVDFWLYFFVYLFGATLGLVYLNNLGQIAESKGYSRVSSLVALSSSFCFFGRLIPSLLEFYVTRTNYMVSRAGTMAVMTAPMCGAFFLLLINSDISLHISTSIIGLCTGAISSIAVSTTSELFGTKGFGVNHNILIINIPIGSFLFGDLAAVLYRRQTGYADGGYGGGGGGGGTCMGVKCYQTTFIIWGSLCFLGTLLALVLHARTKKYYAQ